MTRILLIKLGAFGDVIQADGAIRDIRAQHPTAQITVLTTPAFSKIFARCPHVNAVLTDPRLPRWRLDILWTLKKKLTAEQFDLVYDLQNNGRTRFYRRWLLPHVNWCQFRGDKKLPALTRLEQQLHQAGLSTPHTRLPDLSWMADDVREGLATAGVSGPYIVLIPGCSARHPNKRWPHFATFARLLMAQGHTIVTAPGPDELAEADSFPGIVLKGPRGFYNWFELAGVLKGARFVVGNDTGPSHLAAHLGVAGLALFGPQTSAAHTSIERADFRALEVPDLAALTPETVALHTLAQLTNAT
jgi:ADP-heptose:LPS heptosyltransferase